MVGLPPKQPARPVEEKMFIHARGFQVVSQLALNTNNTNIALQGLVNSAFASELYLKCLLVVEKGQVAKRHELDKLFNLLNPGTRNDIETRFDLLNAQGAQLWSENFYKMFGVRPAWKFRDLIVECADAFTYWRYMYEDTQKFHQFGLMRLPELLKQIILERRPAWHSIGWSKQEEIDLQPTSQAR